MGSFLAEIAIDAGIDHRAYCFSIRFIMVGEPAVCLSTERLVFDLAPWEIANSIGVDTPFLRGQQAGEFVGMARAGLGYRGLKIFRPRGRERMG